MQHLNLETSAKSFTTYFQTLLVEMIDTEIFQMTLKFSFFHLAVISIERLFLKWNACQKFNSSTSDNAWYKPMCTSCKNMHGRVSPLFLQYFRNFTKDTTVFRFFVNSTIHCFIVKMPKRYWSEIVLFYIIRWSLLLKVYLFSAKVLSVK